MNGLKTIVRTVLLAMVLLGFAISSDAYALQLRQPAPVPLLGQPLADAEQLDFFHFFHFSLVDSRPDPNHAGVSLEMFIVGGDFKGQVYLMIATKTSDGTILSASLAIRREFIESTKTTRFARDVAKSFLVLTPGGYSPKMETLIRELWINCAPGTKQYVMKGNGKLEQRACKNTVKESSAYLAFLGKSERSVIENGSAKVILKNFKESGGKKLLFITMNHE